MKFYKEDALKKSLVDFQLSSQVETNIKVNTMNPVGR